MNGSSSRYWSSLSAWPEPKSPTRTRSAAVHIMASLRKAPGMASPQPLTPRQPDPYSLSKRAVSRLASSNATLTALAPRLSPYEFNPFDLNPLREILAREVDFDAVRTDAPVRLLLGTTRVSDGALRIFRTKEVTSDVVLASACLPHLHHAVTIEGEAYWDGGYAANPPLIPLVTATKASDVLVVQIVPSNGSELPKTAPEIDKRLNQITFSNSLQKDLEALSMMTQLSQAEGETSNSRLGRKLQRLQLHRIAAEDHVDGLSGSSFTDTDWALLLRLRDQGRAAADTWLASPAAHHAAAKIA